jgi:uncharacterized protein YdhG (YjbR/CyaY superfamily)
MANADFTTVDEYIEAQPEDVRPILQVVRDTIRSAVPDAEESISYQIPAYRLQGARVVYFAGWKKHFSLYPAPDHVLETFKDELAPYGVEKGTIRFPLSEPVPVDLIAGIAKLRAKDALAEGNGA